MAMNDLPPHKPVHKEQQVTSSGSQHYFFLKPDQLLLAFSLGALGLFVPLTWWANKHSVAVLDVAITHALQKKESAVLRFVATVVSIIGGSPRLLLILVAPVAFAFWKLGLRLACIILVGLALFNELTKTVMKHIVKRPRPSPLLVHVYQRADGPSFPSGNVVSALTFWGWLFAVGMILLKGKHGREKALLSVPCLLVALVGPARVYLGDHWTSDVLGGYLFGGGWLGLAVWLYLKLKEK